MTIYKSDAVSSGLMPDYSRAGVVLCRTGTYVTTTDNMVSGDTIQMVPIPKYAMILDIHAYCSAKISNATGVHIGDGASTCRFFDDASWGDLNYLNLLTDGKPTAIGYTYDEGNDTIDITLATAVTKVVTSTRFTMHVWYKMTNAIKDETWAGLP